LTDKDREDYQR